MLDQETENTNRSNEGIYKEQERRHYKNISLEAALRLGTMTADVLVREAKIIYDWLTEDLK